VTIQINLITAAISEQQKPSVNTRGSHKYPGQPPVSAAGDCPESATRKSALTRLIAELEATGPTTISILASAAGDAVLVLPTLYHLMWTHEISVDVSSRLLNTNTVVGARQMNSGAPSLRIGDFCRFEGQVSELIALDGFVAKLRGSNGSLTAVKIAELFADSTFEVITPSVRRRPIRHRDASPLACCRWPGSWWDNRAMVSMNRSISDRSRPARGSDVSVKRTPSSPPARSPPPSKGGADAMRTEPL
jgi:hypothetical protein